MQMRKFVNNMEDMSDRPARMEKVTAAYATALYARSRGSSELQYSFTHVKIRHLRVSLVLCVRVQ